ncbi:MAG: spermidine synthase, partial [Armatimonadetes bacterium]|nr:spermidine synthase [Armatimonadota bacterium]
DGRRFLRDTKEKYDFVILDAFTGDSPPSHLLTCEALREAKRVLNPNGVL